MAEDRIPRQGTGTTLLYTETAQAIIDYLNAFLNLEFLPKDSGKLHVSPNKIILELKPGADGGAAALIPLAPYDDSLAGVLRVSFRYGTVNGLELSSYGPVTITATRYFFARVNTDASGVATSVTFIDQASATPSADTDTTHYIYLGRAVVTSGVMSEPERNLAGSQEHTRCGYTGSFTHHHWLV